jgi:WD40 repeat protein
MRRRYPWHLTLLGALLAPAAVIPAALPPSITADPLVIPDCRLAVIERQDVPSQRDGVLLFVGTEIKDGEQVPVDRLITVKVGGQEKKYRRLREGDRVEAGQLVALLDDRLARDEWAIKKGQVVVNEAELAAAERARDEAKDRYLTQLKLRSSTAGPATSEEDLGGARVLWYHNHYDAVSKQEAIALARLELHQAETVLGMYEIRSAIPGVIKRVYKNAGEAVRNLEPVIEVRNLGRLRAEGLIDVACLPRLHEGMTVLVEAALPQSREQTFAGNLQDINAVAVGKGQHGPVIAAAAEDGTVRVWDRATRQERRVLRHAAAVRALACTAPAAAARMLLAGTADGSAWLWDLDGPGEQPRHELKAHRGAVTCVAFSPDGRTCATGGEDRRICLWDTATGGLRYEFAPGHLGAVTSLQFPLPSRLLSAGRDNTLRSWAVGERAASPELTLAHRSGDVTQLGGSADGRRALFDQGSALHVVALPTGVPQGVLPGPSAAVNFANLALFSPDGRLVLTAASADGGLRLWRTPEDCARGREVGQLVSPDRSAITSAAFAPDGSFVVAATRSRQVLVWSLPPLEEVERQFPAKLTLVEQAVETSARQVRVWAELPNPDGRLIPGTTVTLVIGPGE